MRREELFVQRGAGTAASAAAHSLFLLRRAWGMSDERLQRGRGDGLTREERDSGSEQRRSARQCRREGGRGFTSSTS